ncbi:hypothetical protein GGR56DRAFT_673852 [Xylariaceae sp. FL0804]|nr:hypothetical protein GGR56DRAFT_673852 [Xylariaceae sp. FL0804]
MSATFVSELEAAQEEMRARMSRYAAAWQALDTETMLSYFVDENLDYYSDYGLMAMHMDKTALKELFQLLGTTFGDMKVETTGVHGAGDFCVWECTFEFTLLQDMPGVPYKKGERARLFNASTIHWNKDGKIYQASEYAIWANAPSPN